MNEKNNGLKHGVSHYLCFGLSFILIVGGILLSWKTEPSPNAHWLSIGGAALAFLVLMSTRFSSFSKGDTRIELDSQRIVSQVVDKVGDEIDRKGNEIAARVGLNLESNKERGTKWINNWKAFKDAETVISQMAEEREGGSIELRIMAIAMSTSLDFVTGPLCEIASNYKRVQFKLRIAVTKSEFLTRIRMDTADADIAMLSRELPGRLDQLKERLAQERIKNLSIDRFFYEGIPQWHGLLVDGTKLFLGRTDWDFHTESRLPRLRCGENDYRYFDTSTPDGMRRINQFRHWFTFFSDFDSLGGEGE